MSMSTEPSDQAAHELARTAAERRSRQVEAVAGLVLVLALLAPLLFLLARGDGTDERGQRVVVARFTNLGGLTPGSLVRIGGVDVGRVREVKVDSATLLAEVVLAIDERFQVPADSRVYVGSEGVFGGSFIGIVPGTDSKTLPPRGRIAKVENVRTLEESVAEAAFSSGLK